MRRPALTVLLSWLAFACAKETPVGGLMLRLRSDLKVPDKVDSVGIYIQRIEDGRTTTLAPIEVKASGPKGGRSVVLPGELAIENPGHPGIRVRVRVVAYDITGKSLVMRESRVEVPTARVASLPMPLLWMNTDDVADADPAAGGPVPIEVSAANPHLLQNAVSGPVDAFARFRSDFCGDERTLDDSGACSEIEIDVTTLPSYEPTAPTLPSSQGDREGPAAAPGGALRPFCATDEKPSCFDLARCFADDADPNYRPVEIASERIEGLGTSSCSVSLGDLPDMRVQDVALAVKTTETEGATCTGNGACYIALDVRSGASLDLAARRVSLPPGVCRKASKGSVVAVVASPLCARREVEEATCENVSCLDGSGWNLERDPGVRPEEDGGTEDGGVLCAEIAGATGFWVDDQTVTLLGAGTVTRFDARQFVNDCLSGAPQLASAVPLIDEDVPYRLLGPREGAGAVAFSGARASSQSMATAGLLTEPVSLIPAQEGVGLVQGAAFFSPQAPNGIAGQIAFTAYSTGLTDTGVYRFVLPTDGGLPSPIAFLNDRVDSPSNVIVDRNEAGTLQAVRTSEGNLGMVSCATACTLEPSSVAAQPVFLTGSDNETFLLARNRDDDSVFVFSVMANNALTQLFGVQGGSDLPDEMTMAISGTGLGRHLYYATNQVLNEVTVTNGALAPVAALEQGTFHAVQVHGSYLYWLESDGSARATLHRRELDANGAATK